MKTFKKTCIISGPLILFFVVLVILLVVLLKKPKLHKAKKPRRQPILKNNPMATKTIFCFWTGKNVMSRQREDCIVQLRNVSEANVVLVTDPTPYILSSDPLHPAYVYLSETHKADYLRTYFMHFYGGGYSDIKKTTGSWLPAFQQLEACTQWLAGYPEVPHGGCEPYNYKDLVGCCAFICKPQTPLTTEWYSGMLRVLDKNLLLLERFPATHPQDQSETSNGKYPLAWTEILGRVFHAVCDKYKRHLLQTLPLSVFINYR